MVNSSGGTGGGLGGITSQTQAELVNRVLKVRSIACLLLS